MSLSFIPQWKLEQTLMLNTRTENCQSLILDSFPLVIELCPDITRLFFASYWDFKNNTPPSVQGLQCWIHLTYRIGQNPVLAGSDGVPKLPPPTLDVDRVVTLQPAAAQRWWTALLRSALFRDLSSEAGESRFHLTLLQKHLLKTKSITCCTEDME